LLQPIGLRVLERLGLGAPIRASGARIDRLLGTTASGRGVMDLRYRDAAPDAHGIGIHRGALSAASWSAVEASRTARRTGCRVDALTQDESAVTLRHSDGADTFDLS
jgi:2-polyprenyl-6-methoxyphenol hydroxylase-like FAD-dependent oxidoreductase